MVLVRAVITLLVMSTCISTAWAQGAGAEARATQLRHDGMEAVALGELERAFRLVHEASGQTQDATVWLELAEIAERLRLDSVCLQAYETYLQRAPTDAANRPEIEGRVRILRHLEGGGGFVIAQDGRTVVAVVDARRAAARSERAQRTQGVIVDWQGRPHVRTTPSSAPLARWDGQAPETIAGDRLFSRPSRSLARMLAAP